MSRCLIVSDYSEVIENIILKGVGFVCSLHDFALYRERSRPCIDQDFVGRIAGSAPRASARGG